MKQTLRNLFVFSALGASAVIINSGCADEAPGTLGAAGLPTTSTSGATGTSGAATGTGGSTAGSFASTSGAPGTSGASGATGTAGSFPQAGTFGSSGSAGAATAGADAGGGGAGGSAAGASGGGAGGTPATDDFPANCPAPTGTHSADKLTKTCWKASASACSLGNNVGLVNPPSNALDADLMTRFSTGAKMVTSQQFMFDVDMGKAVMINGVATQTVTATDVPPQIQVAVSTDGTTWKPVACGTYSSMADISFTAVSARYVRLVQHGAADAWWSMVDIAVFRSGADDTCGTGATTTACTATGMAFPDTCCGASNKL